MSSSPLSAYFERGGKLHCPEGVLKERLEQVRLLLFDWDGVFNSGQKVDGKSSSFSEVDSMGTNLLRYSLYKQTGELPKSFILSGASNPLAKEFAEREHFDGVYLNFKNKVEAIDQILANVGVQAHEVAFFFDDILDLGVAAKSGFRVFLGKEHSPSLKAYVYDNELVDYSTARKGGDNGLREACDFMMASLENYDECVKDRLSFSESYQQYWSTRQGVHTRFQQA